MPLPDGVTYKVLGLISVFVIRLVSQLLNVCMLATRLPRGCQSSSEYLLARAFRNNAKRCL